MYYLFHKVLTCVFCCLSFYYLLCPSSGDTVYFHRTLASYCSQNHLGDAQNLTSGDDLQPTQATWPAPTQSEKFLL